jgi:starch phosphorylase
MPSWLAAMVAPAPATSNEALMTGTSGKIPYLPARIAGLERLALNLWWRWNRSARLFWRYDIDPVLWSAVRHNPVAMLRQIEPGRLAELAADETFLAKYDAIMAEFERELTSEDTWFRRTHPELADETIAYFCAEFGLHSSIPIYSGGLGVLAGDHCKAASDLGVPLVGVGLIYHKGYFDQHLNLEGWQESSGENFDPADKPLVHLVGPDGKLSLSVLETAGRDIHIGAWRLDVGRVRLFLLDTNLQENHPDDRGLTYQLYGGGREHRLKQEWVLGAGGVRVLRALGIEPAAWHANEGHAAFMMVERLREHLGAGVGFAEAVTEVRSRTVFTTHTPVPAGHDMFAPELVEEVCGAYPETMGLDMAGFSRLGHHPVLDHGRFHMTAAGIRLAAHVNGVSRRHGEVTRELWASMWPGRDASAIPIRSVTNGVHLGSWMAHSLMELLDEHFGDDWGRHDEAGYWDRVLELDDEVVWNLHLELKKQLLDFCREEARGRWKTLWKQAEHLVGAGTLLGPKPLTIVFARRFATYKRAHLLFLDEERLQRLLTDPHRPVQILFAGKAHPADDGAKRVLQRVWQATRDVRFEGRIAFVEDYEMHLAHRLVQGADLWLNVPRVPMEASGTSGMKAGLNLVPQLSTIDGWWAEGFDGTNGWALPLSEGSEEEVDRRDHESLFRILEREVVPLYYDRDAHGIPKGYVAKMKNALRVAASHYTTRRMVQEYANDYYAPALVGSRDFDDPPTDATLDVPQFDLLGSESGAD